MRRGRGRARQRGCDLERARALLAEAGWSDSDGDGLLDRELHPGDGKRSPFEFRLSFAVGQKETDATVNIFAEDLAEIGVRAVLDPQEWSSLQRSKEERRFDAYLGSKPVYRDGLEPGDLIAYFCFEYGWHESFPIYSGGLGVLAGDHCKTASDLNLPFVAVGLLYRHGYFHQRIDRSGQQMPDGSGQGSQGGQGLERGSASQGGGMGGQTGSGQSGQSDRGMASDRGGMGGQTGSGQSGQSDRGMASDRDDMSRDRGGQGSSDTSGTSGTSGGSRQSGSRS